MEVMQNVYLVHILWC